MLQLRQLSSSAAYVLRIDRLVVGPAPLFRIIRGSSVQTSRAESARAALGLRKNCNFDEGRP